VTIDDDLLAKAREFTGETDEGLKEADVQLWLSGDGELNRRKQLSGRGLKG
jgi:hypothetical protein